MKHKHHDVIVAWAADTSKVVQVFDLRKDQWVDHTYTPQWHLDREYRIKPEPLPDVVCKGIIELEHEKYPRPAEYRTKFRVSEHFEKDNVRVVFDGDTGKLKSVEVL